MNFSKAHKELLKGEKIRRKEWEPLMHMKLAGDEVKTFKGEYTEFYADASVLLSKDWKVIDGDGSNLTFLEALEELKTKKQLTNDKWPSDKFIFVDGDQIAVCRAVEYQFMPTYKCLCATDWEIMR